MFVGTPCQIHGLKLFLRKDYENLITVDFVCHGVPSPKIWKIYLNKTAKTNDIKQISFRNKKLGWENYSFVLQYKKQKSLSETLRKNPYLRGFIHDIYLRPCCYVCKTKVSKVVVTSHWPIFGVLKIHTLTYMIKTEYLA